MVYFDEKSLTVFFLNLAKNVIQNPIATPKNLEKIDSV